MCHSWAVAVVAGQPLIRPTASGRLALAATIDGVVVAAAAVEPPLPFHWLPGAAGGAGAASDNRDP